MQAETLFLPGPCPQGVCCALLYSFNSLFLHRGKEGGKFLAANLKAP